MHRLLQEILTTIPRIPTISLVALLVAGVAAPSVQAQNLIDNPFCTRSGTPPEAWGGGGIVTCGNVGESGTPTRGESSGNYFYTDEGGEGDQTITQTIGNLVAGETYRFRVFIASTSSGSSDELVVTLQFQDGGGANVGSSITLLNDNAAGTAWEEREVTGITAPSGAAQALLTVTFDDNDGGFADAFADDFFFTGPTSTPVEHINNRSLEHEDENEERPNWVFSEDGSGNFIVIGEDVNGTFGFPAKDGSIGLMGSTVQDLNGTATQLIEGIASGDAHDFSLWVAHSSTTDDIDVSIQFQDANGNDVGTPFTDTGLTGADGSFQQVSHTDIVAPAGAAQALLTLSFNNNDNGFIDVIADQLSFVSTGPANNAPVFNSSSTANFAEHGTGTALDVNADDGDGGSNDANITYSLSGGADQGQLSINASTGELTFDSSPDFENPADSDTNNDYVVEVTADDGGVSNNTTTQTITVNVTDIASIVVNAGGTEGSAPCVQTPDATDLSEGISQFPGEDVTVCPGSYSEATLDVSSAVTLESGADVTITDQLTLSSNTLDVTNGSLTLTSTGESGSARIAGSGSGTISGDVTVERFIEYQDGSADGPHWRMIASPVDASLDDADGSGEGSTGNRASLLSNTWTQGDGVTGANYQGTGTAPSVFYYDETATVGSDETAGWSGVNDFTNPSSQTGVSAQQGFAVYLFQDRDFDGSDEGFPLTLSATGSVAATANNGTDVSLPVTCTDNDGSNNGCNDQVDGWNLVTNPLYLRIHSSISDLEAVARTNQGPLLRPGLSWSAASACRF